MNGLQSITRYFYSEETRRSDVQLAHDFGEFPPAPLDSQGLDREFILVRTRGIGGLGVNLLMLHRIWHVLHPDEISPALHPVWQVIQATRLKCAGSVKELRASVHTRGQRIVFAMIVAPLTLLAALVVLPWVAFKAAKLLVDLHRHIPRGLGYFVPFFADETRIVVKADRLAKRPDGDAVIAHEHLHLLQHRHGMVDDKYVDGEILLCAATWREDFHLQYMLEKNEVEARLHEVVLSYYRVVGQLPLDLDGFVQLLAGSRRLGPWVLEAMGTPVVASPVAYDERSDKIGEDLLIILLSIRDAPLRRRFVTEVLAVMYGHLLGYYGDDAASRKFLKDVAQPNLHDALYASHRP
jgi:hypothetical protein